MNLSMSAWALAIVITTSADVTTDRPMHVLNIGPTWVGVTAAVAGALKRLESPSCQRVLTDFADEHGRPLADRLAATGFTLPLYVARLYAVDGDRERGCANGRTRAFTAPGSHVIFLCSHAFRKVSDIANAQITIIHEVLHTLGLGEDPPSSTEITRQVAARCRVF